MTGPDAAVAPETELTLDTPVLLHAVSTKKVSKPKVKRQPTLNPIKHLPGEALGAQRQAETEQI
jgi:hypothetical protein